MRSKLLTALFAVLVFVVGLGIAARLHLELPVGRRALGDLLERIVSSEVAGSMQVGVIEHASPGRIAARDVVFRTEDGEDAMSFEWVELEPDLGRLLRERCIATRRARLRGVELFMIEREGVDGLPLERAFDSPHDREGGGGITFDFANIAFSDLDSEWRFPGLGFRMDDASGLARIVTDPEGGIVMRFDRIAASARSEGLPMNIEIDIQRASGGLHTEWRNLGRFDIEMTFLGSPVAMELQLRDGEGGVRVRARTEADPLSISGLALLGVDLVTTLSGDSDAIVRENRADDGDGEEEDRGGHRAEEAK